MKLVPLGEANAASCVDGVCEIPGAEVDGAAVSEAAVDQN